MSHTAPTLVWFRKDLRLSDHAALLAACADGGAVVPVFIHDDSVEALAAAPKWRLGHGIGALQKSLRARGSELILRKGKALDVLQALIEQTGARAVYWSRLYDPDAVARDTQIKAELKEAGIDARSFGGHLMFEPMSVETKTGGPYRVYTPFWNSVKTRDVAPPRAAPKEIAAPAHWPASEELQDWGLGDAMRRGGAIVAQHMRLGEEAAQDRLAEFIEDKIASYKDKRDLPSCDGTSGLSENLALGEISPHQCWHAGARARAEGKPGAETFMKELVWREFAYHLMHHTPHMLTQNWKRDWDAFNWNTQDTPDVIAWKQGRTGEPFVDAAMREMYVTGRMHNRARMIAASYLTKHLMTHWKVGQAWFEDCLIDWDIASNAMGWQWCAGSGPDASPFFRVFNPETQAKKFDPEQAYVDRWIAEGRSAAHDDARAFFDAIPCAWGLSATDDYPSPIISLARGRERALEAYSNRSF